MKANTILFFIFAIASSGAMAGNGAQCKTQTVEGVQFEMCMHPGEGFQHDLYSLRADKALIFSLVDDYADQVELIHTLPEGLAIEFPLSRQGTPTVKISGGCIPESKDGAEVARICNFKWGKFQAVSDVRFEFK